MESVSKPIIAFVRACEDLLNDSITSETLTSEEMDILEVRWNA